MNSSPNPNQSPWRRIEALFELWRDLKNEVAQLDAYYTVKIDEVETNLYKELVEPVKDILKACTRQPWPEETKRELIHEAIAELFNAYAGFKGHSSLRTYCTAVVKNTLCKSLKKLGQEKNLVTLPDEDLASLMDKEAAEQFSDQRARVESRATPGNDYNRVLEETDWDQLTDKECIAVMVKIMFEALAPRRFTDEMLARTIGMRRTTFLDSFARGRNKIRRQLREDRHRGPSRD